MKTEWDYSDLAKAYLKRPQYAAQAVDAMLKVASVEPGQNVCDVGAGVGHLTKLLLGRQLRVTAVEPNDSMRELGIRETHAESVKWVEATGEDTGLVENSFRLVTFGSSFNVCDRGKALIESSRILESHGWFACMWNHRVLSDPLQATIEALISQNISDYSYGTRREDQYAVIKDSGLFEDVTKISARVSHEVPVAEFVEAWKSHATLERQAGSNFRVLVSQIEKVCLEHQSDGLVVVPYETNLWMAQKKI